MYVYEKFLSSRYNIEVTKMFRQVILLIGKVRIIWWVNSSHLHNSKSVVSKQITLRISVY